VPSSGAPTAAAKPYVTSADMAGAFAFVREYFRRLEVAANSGNVQPLTVMRTAACPCIKFEIGIRQDYSKGDYNRGVAVQLKTLTAGTSGPAFAKVGAPFIGKPFDILHAGRLVRRAPAITGEYLVDLVIQDGSWRIEDVHLSRSAS